MEEDIRTLVKEELEKFNNENKATIFATEIEFRTKLQKNALPSIEAVLAEKVTKVIKETVENFVEFMKEFMRFLRSDDINGKTE